MIPAARIPGLAAALAVGLAIVAGAGACHRQAPTARERVLAALPAAAVTVVVADGAALSHPRIRGVLDAAAARWPASLGCLVDAAIASETIGASLDATGNLTVIAALPRPPRCPALSQREPGLWIATLGTGPSSSASVADDPRFARARPYLTGSPLAAALYGDTHVVAAAQPEPLDAWLAIDTTDADPIAQAIAEQVARLGKEPATAAVAARLHTTRIGAGQLVVRLTGPLDGELAAATRSVLAWLDAAGSRASPLAAAPAAPFRCPAPAADVSCTGGTRYRVGSLASDLSPIVDVGQPTPIVVNGSVTGLRLYAAVAAFGLQAGDIVVAMAGRLVTSRTMLADSIAHARVETTVTVRRGSAEAILEFAER
jgi:hypothetical protein